MAPLAHKPRKRFGQHFLNDLFFVDAIIHHMNFDPQDHVIEIGPGLGALTKPLLAQLQQLTVIELDRDLIAFLRTLGPVNQLHIIHQDVLKVCFNDFQRPIHLVGNLPYNISTPLIFHLLQYNHCIQNMHFMFQKEVGLRLCATVGDSNYSRLSVMTQYYYHNELLLDIPPQAFKPPPQVDSVFVRLTPHATLPYTAIDETLLGTIVTRAFNQRRKMLSNTLKSYLTSIDFKNLAIDPTMRPEQLSVQQFVQLSNFIHQKIANP